MAALVLDSGALIAVERGDREIAALLSVAAVEGVEVVTSSACAAQVWRNPSGQVRLGRMLEGCVERALDPGQAKLCGLALARSKTTDVPDAALCVAVRDGDTVLTSDCPDISRILEAIGTRAVIKRV
ncbi:MAG: hypothetical protein ACTHM1_10015 [Solirubrobacteraceae bacterium]